MSNYVDYKCTIWGRLHFTDDADMSVVIKKLEEGLLPDEIADPELKFNEFEFIYDTEEYMLPSENNNQTTIEVYTGDGAFQECVWENVNSQNTINNDLETNN